MHKTLDRVMGQMIREAAREWLRAVLMSVPARGGFPVWSGAAKSTLVPLGRFLRINVPVHPDTKAPDRRALGEASQTFHIRDDKSDPMSFVYEFEWSTDLLHYYINEFFGVIPSAMPNGWRTAEAGERAFLDYLATTLPRRLPLVFAEIDFDTGII